MLFYSHCKISERIKKRPNPGGEEKRKSGDSSGGLTWEWIEETVMGGMGWMPDDFYRQEMNTTLTALAGYLKRRSDDERIQRRTAVMISSPWMDKGFDPYKWWPIAGDDNTKISRQKSERDRRLARLRELKELDAKNKLLGN